MIPHDIVHKLVEKMTADTGRHGIETMCKSVGINFDDVKETLTRNFGPPNGSRRSLSQLALDMMMLGAAIGYLYGKGESLNEIRPEQSDFAN